MNTECLVFENRVKGDSTTSLKNYLKSHHPDYYVKTDLKRVLCVTLGYLEDTEDLENLKSIVNSLQCVNVNSCLEKASYNVIYHYPEKSE